MGLHDDLFEFEEHNMKVCEECLNYKKAEPEKSEQIKMDCYKNKCAECLCKACADFNDCDNKKCYSCKFRGGYNIWTSGIATWTPTDYGLNGTISSNPCDSCYWPKQLREVYHNHYVGDTPCQWCPNSPNKVTCSNGTDR